MTSRYTTGWGLDSDAVDALSGRERHKPGDTDAIRAAAREMAHSGLTARDIAASFGLTEAAIRQLLSENTK